jgi:hypothetical protein
MDQKFENPQTKIVELTAHLQEPIDKALRVGYPLIDRRNPEAQSALAHFHPDVTPLHSPDSLARVSFDPQKYREPLTNQTMRIALARAANPNDTAYARHGSEHVVFDETIRRLKQTIESREPLDIYWQPIMVQSNLDTHLEFPATRLVIETPPFTRSSARPDPYIEAQVAVKPKQGQIPRELRRIARTEYGTARAILAGLYAGLSPEAIMHALDETNLKQELIARKLPYITNSRASDKSLIRKLEEIMFIELDTKRFVRRSSEAYLSALSILEQAKYLPQNASHIQGFGFSEYADTVTARAVFIGLSEIAQQVAPIAYHDPLRTSYIDTHYGKLATTILATAFIPQEQ